MTIDISNVINVTLAGTPQGISATNINSVALFTTETPSNVDPYRIYLNSKEVANDYGTSSITKKMADNIFSQSPNIISGAGRLVIVPLESSVSATQGNFETDDISGNLASIIAVTDGELRIVLNGTNVDLTNLNFSAATTFSDIAKIIQAKLKNVIVEAVANTGLKFTSKKVGNDSDVVLGSTGGSGTDLSAAGFFNQAAGTETSGVNASGETIVSAISRVEDSVSFVGVITNLEMEDSVISSLASAIQAQNRIFVHHFASTEDIAGIATTLKDAGYTKFRSILYTENLSSANLAKAAYIGRSFSVNFSGSVTSQTMNLKSLTGVTEDKGINQTDYINALSAGLDLYINYGGKSAVASSGWNDYFDNVYNQLWLKFNLEVAGFNFLAKTNTKIPQTEEGMDGLLGAYEKVLKDGVRNGVIGTGLAWNSSETFGSPEDLKRNILDTGYYIYALPIAQQSQADREARKAPLVQIAIKFAGAIHSSEIIAIIEE